MFRFFQYFKGMRLRRNRLYIGTTGAVISIDKSFRSGFVSGLKVYLYFRWRGVRDIFMRPVPLGTIAFHPETPGPWYNIWQVVRLAKLNTVSDIAKADHIFIFEDKTISEYDKSIVENLNKPKINHRIDDITKEYVADVFENVFGYALRINPLTYTGPATQKSNDNGKHDGMVINCPIAASDIVEGQTYQRLVDSTFNGKTSEDYRIAYVLGEIALVYHKHKPLDDRFGTDYLSVDVRDAVDIFSDDEINLITKFCGKMRLDFGAVDIMRDKHNGRIYIVDVNKTCMPVLCLSLKKQIASQQKIADALNRGLKRPS